MKTYGQLPDVHENLRPDFHETVRPGRGFVPDPRFPILSGASLVLGHEAAGQLTYLSAEP